MHCSMRLPSILTLFASTFCFATTTHAAFTQQPLITASVAVANADSERNIDDDGVGFRFGFGQLLGKHTLLELQIGALEYDSNNTDLSQANIGLEASFVFNQANKVQPYFLIAAGYQENESNSNNLKSEGAYADIGVGLFTQIGSSGAFLRTDLRMRRDFHDDINNQNVEFDDLVAHIGLSFPLGSSDTSDNSYQPNNSSDTDRDGIADTEDYCPDTTPHAAVDRNGCSRKQNGESEAAKPTLLAPPRSTPRSSAPPRPAETKAAPTNKQATSAASEKATPPIAAPKPAVPAPAPAPAAAVASATVDKTAGTTPKRAISNPSEIRFLADSAALTAESKVLISELAKHILNQGMRVEITGSGRDQRIKTIRAKSVAQQLLGHQVPASRILINNSRYSERTLIHLQRQ